MPDSVLEMMEAREIKLVPAFTVARNYHAPVEACIEILRRHVARGGAPSLSEVTTVEGEIRWQTWTLSRG